MKIKINTEYINLGQFLQIAGIVYSGGEAKYAVKEMEIYVNGEAENRRGRKLYPNDKVEVDGDLYTIE